MGAEKPTLPKTSEKLRKPRFRLIMAMAVLLGIVLFQIVNSQIGETTPSLSPEEEAKLQKRLKELDNSEQYALIAKANGWYPCLHSGLTTYYLLKGEVWKYGVTSKGEFRRYTLDFLTGNSVSYLVQFKGNYAECLKQEQHKLFAYPQLLENLARSPDKRLPRPPYNRIMR